MPMKDLLSLLNRDPIDWRTALDRRYPVLDAVLAGERTALLYPAGRLARRAAPLLLGQGVRLDGFGDGALSGTIDGLPVRSPDEIGDAVVLVASTLHDAAICRSLRARGCEVVPVGYLNLRLPDSFGVRELDGAGAAILDPANRDAIRAAYELLVDDESRAVFVAKLDFYLRAGDGGMMRSPGPIYFDVRQPREDEVFVDAGAFTGDTLASFLGLTNGRFREYVAVEPDAANLVRLQAVAGADQRIACVQAGLGDTTSESRLLGTGIDARLATAGEAGGVAVPIVSLDDYFGDRRAPTFVKMDVEGAERDALNGGRRLLRSARPFLAISAYHHPADLWRIPIQIEGLVRDCDFRLRHYTEAFDDTVCYALPA